MWRRYHETVIVNGEKKDVVVWRKRVIDENGKVRFIKAPLDEVGTGTYRSARKNANRLTRTEINMAYHRANHERWMQEPFVIGQRIDLSTPFQAFRLPLFIFAQRYKKEMRIAHFFLFQITKLRYLLSFSAVALCA